MDSIVSFLTSCSPTHRSKGFLEGLGKTAAQKMVAEDTEMNKTIAGYVREHSLNREQTSRVVESANNEAFVTLLQKEAGYVTFPVADTDKCTSRKAMVKIAKAKYVPGEDFITTEKLASALFGEAAAEEAYASPVDTVDQRHKLQHLLDTLEDHKTQALEKVAELQNFVAGAVQTGELSVADIQRALLSAGTSEELTKIACAKTEVHLGSAPGEAMGSVPNLSHPLLKKAAACRDAAIAYVQHKQSVTTMAREMLNGKE